MRNLWNSAEAAAFPGDLGQRVYSSRLLGREPSLVLHGGGNTSVKTVERNVFGEDERILRVKGSGWDLSSIEAKGFAPCRLSHLTRLATLDALPDLRMAQELRACMTDPAAPMASVEAILHAVLPARFVDHTHADALISVTNTDRGPERVREIYGERVVVIPYVMPGFKLARLFAELFPKQCTPGTEGVVLMGHGMITFGSTAEESYGRMIALVTEAEDYLARHKAWVVGPQAVASAATAAPLEIAAFRRAVSGEMGAPAIVSTHGDAVCASFARLPDILALTRQGPATPDHVIRTKRVPLVGRDLNAYRLAYTRYFDAWADRSSPRPTMLDPAPRVVLDPEWGMLAVGRTAQDASIVGDLYRHTIDIVLRSERIGGWRGLSEEHIFDVEYWDLEQAKLRRAGPVPVFQGEVALVTGAASGIGRACVDALLSRGAAVVGLDLNPGVCGMIVRPDFLGVACDLTREDQVRDALGRAVAAFGGVDMLVLNAGIFPGGKKIGELGTDLWRRVMAVNLDSSFVMLREAHPLLTLAPRGGRVAVIGSKNVPAPGPGAAAYSASKAAVNQLMRVAALEWGADNIRINALHPNMVFDTALWTPEILESRARHYGLSVEAYRTNNLLKVEVHSRDVAELAAELCGPLFAKTTGAQVPVDGGNERVI